MNKRYTFLLLFLIISISGLVITAQNDLMDLSNRCYITNAPVPIGSLEYWNAQITRPVGNTPFGIFIGDANNDGQNDIVIANLNDNNVSILLWNATARDWDPQIIRAVGNAPFSVIIGDANNDGQNDIVTANQNDDNVSILLWNTTAGDWDPQITRAVGYSPYNAFLGDANNDGQNDIVTTIYLSNISILLWNTTAGDWDPHITRPVGSFPNSVFIGDANNDGQNDIVASNKNDDNVSILLWNTTAGDWDPQITRAVGDWPWGVYIGDANNDGHNDIVTANWNDDNVSILLWNTTAGDWDPQITRAVGIEPLSVFVGDANNDGHNDIVSANNNDDNVSILLWNTTTGDWDPQITQPVGDMPYSVYIGDANNDGQNDLATANGADKTVSILLGNRIPWSPMLEPLIPDPNENGIIELNWSNVLIAPIYYVYRNISNINSIAGLPPIAVISESNYTDTITINGIYYYVIVAGNIWGNSSISNCENVTVAIPPSAPVLNPILPGIDDDGIIALDWNDVVETTTYYVYRDTLNITSVAGLTPIAVISESNYTDNISNNGIYYYAIIAGNIWANSSISNCESVTVDIPPEKKPISGFEVLFVVISLIAIIVIYLRKKNFCKLLKS
ncbi:MAG: FG-GAP-like repeat-containing protein [Promethearchaeota archaeon]